MNQFQEKNDAVMRFMMYITAMTDDRKIGKRTTYSLWQDQESSIDDFMHENRIRSESDAVRQLIDLAFDAIEKQKKSVKSKQKKS